MALGLTFLFEEVGDWGQPRTVSKATDQIKFFLKLLFLLIPLEFRVIVLLATSLLYPLAVSSWVELHGVNIYLFLEEKQGARLALGGFSDTRPPSPFLSSFLAVWRDGLTGGHRQPSSSQGEIPRGVLVNRQPRGSPAAVPTGYPSCSHRCTSILAEEVSPNL